MFIFLLILFNFVSVFLLKNGLVEVLLINVEISELILWFVGILLNLKFLKLLFWFSIINVGVKVILYFLVFILLFFSVFLIKVILLFKVFIFFSNCKVGLYVL